MVMTVTHMVNESAEVMARSERPAHGVQPGAEGANLVAHRLAELF